MSDKEKLERLHTFDEEYHAAQKRLNHYLSEMVEAISKLPKVEMADVD